MGSLDRTDLDQDRNRWWVPVNAVMKLRVNIKHGEFVDYLGRVSFSGKILSHVVTYKNASSTVRKTRALNCRWMKASYAILLPWLFFVFLTSSHIMS